MGGVKSAPRFLAPLLIALSAILLLGVFSTELSDPDAWWHLATGRYIATQHRLPVPDPFAYTTAISPPANAAETRTRYFNLTHEWLAQCVWYAIEALGGIGAVVLWKALLLAILCGLTGWVAARRTGSWLWGIAAALAAATLATVFDRDRPSILTYVFTAAFIAIFEDRRRLWLLPPLALIWANCHGGYFLGWIVCGAYCAEALVRREKDGRRLMIFSAAAVLVSGLNPNGFGAIATVLDYQASPMQATLIEWSHGSLWGPPYAFDVLLYAAAAVLVASWKRVRLADWLLFAAFAAASLAAFRNEMLIGLLAPILIAAYFPWKRTLVPAIAAGALACAVPLLAGGHFFQLGAAEWRYPAGAATFLQQHAPNVRLFNTYEDGGYLIWRGEKVFIDGRALSESVFQDYRLIMGTPPGDARRDQTLAKYNIGAIVVNSFEYNSGVLYPLVLALAQPSEADWKLVYEDPAALVFLRDVPPGVAVLDKTRIAPHLEAECTLHVERDPEFSLCARTLGDLFLRSGDQNAARRMLGLYLLHPYADDPDARRAYQQLLGR